MLQFSVRVPPSDAAGDVPLTIRYVGSDDYRRSRSNRETREAVATFTYFVPLPVVQSARWCKVCAAAIERLLNKIKIKIYFISISGTEVIRGLQLIKIKRPIFKGLLKIDCEAKTLNNITSRNLMNISF